MGQGLPRARRADETIRLRAVTEPPPQTEEDHMAVTAEKLDKGGHFAAWEQPQLFSEEVRAAFSSLR
jgi:pimeloyl-ACP methyl ester carboxylesterase